MIAEFEEKVFETQLNNELASDLQLIFAPGQVLECTIGIDVALVCQQNSFWRLFTGAPCSLFPASITPRGLQLNSSYWIALDQAIEHFPKYRFNVFLQHKRPEYLSDSRAKEWNHWKRPYYRFYLTPHQQTALEKLAQLAGLDALVAYASPVFHTYSKLHGHARARAVYQHTNFGLVEYLTNHDKYTYSAPGTAGRAYSEPADIEGPDFRTEVQRRRNLDLRRTNRAVLSALRRLIEEAVEGTVLAEQLRSASNLFLADAPITLPAQAASLAEDILKVGAFAHLTQTRWFIG